MATIRAACAVVQRDDGAVLLVKRRYPPEAGLWSVPGGKTESGESVRAAAARETFEETGLHVDIGRRLWTVSLTLDDGVVYELHDFAATVVAGVLNAADDAAEVKWVPPEELAHTSLVAELLTYLRETGIAPLP